MDSERRKGRLNEDGEDGRENEIVAEEKIKRETRKMRKENEDKKGGGRARKEETNHNGGGVRRKK